MKKYIIFNQETDERITEITARCKAEAESIARNEYKIEVYAIYYKLVYER